jgi:hypothetical protein
MILSAKFLKYYTPLLLWSSLSLYSASWCEADPYLDKFFYQLAPGGYHRGTPWVDASARYTDPRPPAYGTVGTDACGMATFTPNPDYDPPLMDDQSCRSIRAAQIDGYTSYPFMAAPLAPDPTFNGHYRFIYAEETPTSAGALPCALAATPAALPSAAFKKPKKPHYHFSMSKTLSRAFHSVGCWLERSLTRKRHITNTKKQSK